MLLKSRYVWIRELELELTADEPPSGEIGDGKFLPKHARSHWLWRQARRQRKICQLAYLIKHDYEELFK